MLREVVDADLLPTERTLAPEAVAEVIVQCLLGAHDEKAGEVLLFPSP
jgi:hypothetical protein